MKPRSDPATRGNKGKRLSVATRMILLELHPELLRPLVAVFGWECAFEMTLKSAMKNAAMKREKLAVRKRA